MITTIWKGDFAALSNSPRAQNIAWGVHMIRCRKIGIGTLFILCGIIAPKGAVLTGNTTYPPRWLASQRRNSPDYRERRWWWPFRT